MNYKHIFLAMTLGAIGAGCSNIERSRDLANPAVPGHVLAVQVCAICHGVDGNSTSPAFPRLAGQQAAYIVNQLKNFRAQGRSDPAGSEYMWGLSHHLTDAQIDDIAAYYAKQKVVAPDVPTDPKLMAAGKDIFENGVPAQNVIACAACHGPKGQGIEAFPRIANQHADYIVKQLNVFQINQGRPGTPMEFIAHPLTGDNKDAVAAYLQDFPN
ncbi:MAG: c-type cytochrome [Rhodocyclaceae bacterium]|nr:c-type cytochrome [Rhodocyclaceae bacterium]